MKWYLINEDSSPMYWCEDDDCVGYMMEFDTEEDANIFLDAARKAYIPEDIEGIYAISLEISLSGSRNYTGFIPVANGNNVKLVRRV